MESKSHPERLHQALSCLQNVYSVKDSVVMTKGSEDRKRQRIANVKYFEKPWRVDNIHKDMKDRRSYKFAEYSTL